MTLFAEKLLILAIYQFKIRRMFDLVILSQKLLFRKTEIRDIIRGADKAILSYDSSGFTSNFCLVALGVGG